MATRPVFLAKNTYPYYDTINVDFEWNRVLAKTQKQKNVIAIHDAFKRRMPDKRVLEISSKSMQEGGEALSAFSLPKYVPELGKSVPVECAYHAGKVFRSGGPYKELLTATPREAKKDTRLQTSGPLVKFTFESMDFPLVPKHAFYDYLYINALLENPDAGKTVLQYDAFTDVEFNPEKSIGCQARACAVFVGLSGAGLLEQVKKDDTFLSLYRAESQGIPEPIHHPVPAEETVKSPIIETVKTEQKIRIQPGDLLFHKKFGQGRIEAVGESTVEVIFPADDKKVLSLQWCTANCEILPNG